MYVQTYVYIPNFQNEALKYGVSELVIKFNSLLETADTGVHVVHTSCTIITYTLHWNHYQHSCRGMCKVSSDPFIRLWIKANWNSHQISFTMEKLSVKWSLDLCSTFIIIIIILLSLCCIYRQVSNIRRTKTQHLKDPRTVLRLSLLNPSKPDVKSRMKM